MTGPDSRLVQLSESIFRKTTHIHGLTKTVKPLLHLAASIHAEGNGAGDGTPNVLSSLQTKRFEKLSSDLPSWQRTVVMDALRMEKAQDAETTGQLRTDGSSYTEIARRLAALLNLASTLAEQSPNEADVVATKENGKGFCLCVRGLPEGEERRQAMKGTELWNRVMPYATTLEAVPRDIPIQDAMLRPDHTLEEALHLIVRKQLRQFLSRIYGLSCSEDLEYVHEMRVATRRMRAAMKLFKSAVSPPLLSLKAEAKEFASTLGRVRDLDVFREFLLDYRETLRDEDPFLLGLIDEVESRRSQGYEELLNIFTPQRMEAFRDRHSWILGPPQRHAGKGAALLSESAPRLIKKRLKKALRYGPSLKKNAPEENHALRIRCKGCRYAAEFLVDLYPDGLQNLVSPMTKMQDLLGNVHDTDVYEEKIALFAEEHASTSKDPRGKKKLLRHLHDWKKESLRKACNTWKHFLKPANVKAIKIELKQPSISQGSS